MSFLDNLFSSGAARSLATPTQTVAVNTDEPALNDVLKITSLSPLRATWEAGGSVGPEGPQGPQGIPGTNGADGAVGPAGPRGLSSNVWVGPQASPDAWDLEASTMIDPDLAANGWTIQLRDNPWTVLTRAGNLDRSLASSAAGTYRSQLVNGVLVLQLPGPQVQIYKASAGAYCYKTHVWCGEFTTGNQSYVFCSTGANFGNGVADFHYAGLENTSLVSVRFIAATNNYTLEAGLGAISEVKRKFVSYLDHDPGVNTRYFAISEEGTVVSAFRTPGLLLAPSSHAGIWLAQQNNRWNYIDFIRRTPLNQFP